MVFNWLKSCWPLYCYRLGSVLARPDFLNNFGNKVYRNQLKSVDELQVRQRSKISEKQNKKRWNMYDVTVQSKHYWSICHFDRVTVRSSFEKHKLSPFVVLSSFLKVLLNKSIWTFTLLKNFKRLATWHIDRFVWFVGLEILLSSALREVFSKRFSCTL